MLAVPELPQSGKPKGAKVGEKKGLNHSSSSFWLLSGFYGPVLPRLPTASLQVLSVPVPGGSGRKQNHFHTEEQDMESWGAPLGCPGTFTLCGTQGCMVQAMSWHDTPGPLKDQRKKPGSHGHKDALSLTFTFPQFAPLHIPSRHPNIFPHPSHVSQPRAQHHRV